MPLTLAIVIAVGAFAAGYGLGYMRGLEADRDSDGE